MKAGSAPTNLNVSLWIATKRFQPPELSGALPEPAHLLRAETNATRLTLIRSGGFDGDLRFKIQ